jgi:hypothetical protein
VSLYDCHGGLGTTEPACGACVTCLHRVIEQQDQRIKRLEGVLRRVLGTDSRCRLDLSREGKQSRDEAVDIIKEAKP